MKTLSVCSISDTGIRPANEDACRVSRMATPWGEITLLSVADGLGGHPAGEVASQVAVQTMDKIVSEQLQYIQKFDTESLMSLMSSAFHETGRIIAEEAAGHAEWQGMATTLVSALVTSDDVCVIGNVGDSRAYRVSDRLERITRDHSRVQELVDKGILTPEEAEFHPHKNIVTRIVGREGDHPDIFTCRLGSAKLLLCSDGLLDGLTEKELQSLTSEPELTELCQDLVEKAKQRSRDNITVILAQWVG
jgi:serine/threonine protein phosphatase PrpC